MHHAEYVNYKGNESKEDILENVILLYEALSEGITNWVANLANCSLLVWHAYHSIGVKVNWAGFYVLDPKNNKSLILGPFQGKVACQEIAIGKGVCGTAAATLQTQVVTDVEKFPGHIACDGETKSEIVVPFVNRSGEFVGLLDIDCLTLGGFDEVDKKYLEELVKKVASSSEW